MTSTRWLRQEGHEPGIKPIMDIPPSIFRRPAGAGGIARADASVQNVIRLPDGTELRELQSPRVEYPAHARRAHLQGVVEVAYWVAPDGAISGVEIVRSAHPTLDQLVLDAIHKARYAPRTEPGARSVRLSRPVSFSLGQ